MSRAFRLLAIAGLIGVLGSCFVASRIVGQELYLAANRPACTNGIPEEIFIVNATSQSDCSTAGGGTAEAHCCCQDAAWDVCGVAAVVGTGFTFRTINAPSGTDPVADSATDTLNLTSGAPALSITGNGGSDTIDFDISGTPSKCARFDASGELVPATDDCPDGDTGGGTSITLDLGDDGGNDSTALSEIATTGDDYNVVTEPSNDKALFNIGLTAPYRQYDPDRPPTSCTSCEDWTGDTAAQTWAWYNQDGSTESIENDGVVITGDLGADELHGRYIAAPSNADQTVTMVMWLLIGGGNGDSCGIEVLYGGTEAAPTALAFLYAANFSTDGIFFQTDTDYNPTAGATTISSFTTFGVNDYRTQRLYLQFRYTDSTRVLAAFWGFTGKHWTSLGATTVISADPISWSYFARREGTCRIEWWRLRTDAGRNNASD